MRRSRVASSWPATPTLSFTWRKLLSHIFPRCDQLLRRRLGRDRPAVADPGRARASSRPRLVAGEPDRRADRLAERPAVGVEQGQLQAPTARRCRTSPAGRPRSRAGAASRDPPDGLGEVGRVGRHGAATSNAARAVEGGLDRLARDVGARDALAEADRAVVERDAGDEAVAGGPLVRGVADLLLERERDVEQVEAGDDRHGRSILPRRHRRLGPPARVPVRPADRRSIELRQGPRHDVDHHVLAHRLGEHAEGVGLRGPCGGAGRRGRPRRGSSAARP